MEPWSHLAFYLLGNYVVCASQVQKIWAGLASWAKDKRGCREVGERRKNIRKYGPPGHGRLWGFPDFYRIILPRFSPILPNGFLFIYLFFRFFFFQSDCVKHGTRHRLCACNNGRKKNLKYPKFPPQSALHIPHFLLFFPPLFQPFYPPPCCTG